MTLPPDNGAAAGADDPESAADFGYRRVAATDRDRLVRAVFDSVADRYDLMNDLMSFGIHRLWKEALVTSLHPRPGADYVDLAGGTGDIAFRILDRLAASRRGAAGARVTVIDANREMLIRGRTRARTRADAGAIRWLVANAEALPVPSTSVDFVTISFGLRNVTRVHTALREARRILRPGGRFLCLEFSRVTVPILDDLYDRYSFSVLPKLGRAVARDEHAYRYLAESIRRFPSQETLARLMGDAGFERVEYRNFSGGIVALHSGWRI